MSWESKPLGSVCVKIGSGVTPKGGDAVYTDHGTSLIRSQNVHNAKFQRDGLAFVNDDIAKKMAGVTVAENDVLLNITGDSVARCCLAPSDVLPARVNQHVLIIRPDTAKLNPVFLAKYLVSPFMQATLLSWAGNGGTRKALTKGMIEALKIPLPDLPTQQRIAGILSAYDDLIENNRRRIGLLEQAARLLYREWFVHLRFPGHETAKIVDGLPEGWVLRRVTDICTVARGASPRPIQNFLDGTVPWFKIGDATASESPFVFDTKEKIIEEGVKRSVFLPAGEMILSNSATCGVPNFTAVDGCIHDGWLYFKDLRHVSKEHLFLFFESKQREMLQGIGEGAVQKNFNTEYVGRQVLPLPQDPALIAKFSDRVQPMFAQIKAFATHNRALTRARDMLLPRLMDGRIPV